MYKKTFFIKNPLENFVILFQLTKNFIIDVFALIRLPLCFIAGIATITGMLMVLSFGSNPQNILRVISDDAFALLTGFTTSFLLVGAANSINDYCDYESDLVNKRIDRPLTKGTLSHSFAWQLSILFNFIGVMITILVFNLIVALVSIFFIFLSYIYSFQLKRVLLIDNIVVAFCTCGPYLYGLFAFGIYEMKAIQAIISILSVIFFCTWGREIIKDALDVEGDKQNNVQTLSTQFGIRFSSIFSLFPMLLGSILSIAIFVVFFPNNLIFLGLICLSGFLLLSSCVALILWPMKDTANKTRKITRMGIQIGALSFLTAIVMSF